jgi:hypothetical protein
MKVSAKEEVQTHGSSDHFAAGDRWRVARAFARELFLALDVEAQADNITPQVTN